MEIHFVSRFFAVSALGVFLLFDGQASPQNKPVNPKQNEALIYSVKGPELYRSYCAACHGVDGMGDGPVAPALKEKPANLTALARNNGGAFPAERVRKIIAGDEPSLLIHGSREMPIWGPIFHQIEEDQDFGNVRLKNLTTYLQSVQQK